MTYLYKLQNNAPLPLIPINTASPTQEQITEYGLANGGKTLVLSSKPGEYYTESYTQTDTDIIEVWTAMPLETAKFYQTEKIKSDSLVTQTSNLSDYSTTEIEMYISNSPTAAVETSRVKGITTEEAQAEIDSNSLKINTIIGIISGYYEKLQAEIKVALDVDAVELLVWSAIDVQNDIQTRLTELGL